MAVKRRIEDPLGFAWSEEQRGRAQPDGGLCRHRRGQQQPDRSPPAWNNRATPYPGSGHPLPPRQRTSSSPACAAATARLSRWPKNSRAEAIPMPAAPPCPAPSDHPRRHRLPAPGPQSLPQIRGPAAQQPRKLFASLERENPDPRLSPVFRFASDRTTDLACRPCLSCPLTIATDGIQSELPARRRTAAGPTPPRPLSRTTSPPMPPAPPSSNGAIRASSAA